MILVTVTQAKERAATGVDLAVTVAGTSLVTGEIALRKAHEGAQLAAALGARLLGVRSCVEQYMEYGSIWNRIQLSVRTEHRISGFSEDANPQ